MTIYRVASPLQHDGIAYAPGDVVAAAALSPAQAAHLTACGTIMREPAAVEAVPAAPAGEGASPPPSPAPTDDAGQTKGRKR